MRSGFKLGRIAVRNRLFAPAALTGSFALTILPACGTAEHQDARAAAGTGAEGSNGQAGVPEPPGGPDTCPAGDCNYQAQSGCSDGRSCQPVLEAGKVRPRCQSTGTKARGEPCEAGECAPGLFCAGGTCRTLCCGGDWSVCADGETCRGVLLIHDPESGDDVSVGAGACLPTNDCDLFGDDCADDQACQIVDNRGSVACVRSGDGTFGDDCDSDNPCSAGFFCSESLCSGEQCRSCRRLCRAAPEGASPACPEAEGICVHFPRDPESVGECVPAS